MPDEFRTWSTAAGSGTPVVMVHGALSDYRYWEPQQIAFARDYRAIALSLRGYYPTDDLALDPSFSAEQHVVDIGAFLATLGEPARLIGHSRGGRIALHVAARFPDHVRSVVLLEPGGVSVPGFMPASPTGPGGPDIRIRTLALIKAGEAENGLRLYIDSGHGAGTWDATPALFKRVALANAATIEGSIHDASAPLSREIAAAVAAPTLLIAGTRSPASFHTTLDVLEAAMPSVSRVSIPDGNHFVSLMAAQPFNEAVLRFFNR